MVMRRVDNFSKYPKIGGNIQKECRLSDFKAETLEDLILIQMAEGIIDRKEFFEREGQPNNSCNAYNCLFVRDLVKGKSQYADPDTMPVIRTIYDLRNMRYTTEINVEAGRISVTAHDIRAKGREKIEAKLKEIFSK